MIINSRIVTKSGTSDEAAVIAVFNSNRGIDIVVKKDIPSYGFYMSNSTYGSYLKIVEFGDEVKRIEERGFYNQAKMTIADFNNIEYIGSNAFTNCENLSSPVMNKVKTISSQAFLNCSSLLELNLPSIETIHGMGSASATFTGCTALEKVVLGENIKILGSGNTRIFSGNSNLTSIHLPASLETLSTYAFYNCINLVNVTIGEGFNVTLNLGLCGDLTQESLENIVGNYAESSGKTLTVTSSTYTLATENLFTGSELTIAEYASAKGLTLASS